MPTASSRRSSLSAATSTEEQLATFTAPTRLPFIPEETLKRHDAYCAVDTRFRRTARLLQSPWLKKNGIPARNSTRPRIDQEAVVIGGGQEPASSRDGERSNERNSTSSSPLFSPMKPHAPVSISSTLPFISSSVRNSSFVKKAPHTTKIA